MGRYLITGANRGIGLELCRQLKQRGDEAFGCCRQTSAGLAELGIRVEEDVRVDDDAAVTALASRLEGLRLDTLINSAGILERVSLDDLDLDSIRRQFEINALGPLRVTRALLPNLGEGAKIAIITSLMGSMTDNSSGSHYGYRMSKAAVNAAGVSLGHDLAARGISVAILHPGFVQTDMTGRRGIPVDESVRGLLARIDALTPETSGSFRHADGRELPW